MSKQIVIDIGANVSIDNVDLKKLESGINKSIKQVRKELEAGGIGSDVAKQLNTDLKQAGKILGTLTKLNTALKQAARLQAQYGSNRPEIFFRQEKLLFGGLNILNKNKITEEKKAAQETSEKEIKEKKRLQDGLKTLNKNKRAEDKKNEKEILDNKRKEELRLQDGLKTLNREKIKEEKKLLEERKSSWFGGGFNGGLGIRSSLGGKVLPYGAGGLAGASFVWGTMASEYFQKLLALQAKSNSSVEDLQKFALAISEKTGGMISRTGSVEFISTFTSKLQEMFLHGGSLAKYLARIGVSDVDPSKPIDVLMKILLSASKVQGADAKAFLSKTLKDLGFSDQMMRIATSPEEYARFYSDFQKQSALTLDELKEIATIQQTQTAALNKLYSILEKIYASLSQNIINPMLEFAAKGIPELLATIAGIIATFFGVKKGWNWLKKSPDNIDKPGSKSSQSAAKNVGKFANITKNATNVGKAAMVGLRATPGGLLAGLLIEDLISKLGQNSSNIANISNTYNITSTDPEEVAQEIAAIKQQETLSFNPAFAGSY